MVVFDGGVILPYYGLVDTAWLSVSGSFWFRLVSLGALKMKKCKMKQMALAVGVALGGVGMLPSAQAVNLATDGLGQALIFPYYTTRAGWTTLFNITNTSDYVVAMKVRFHEAYNSRGVFDFDVVMSARDVWNGWVENGPDNVPVFKTADTSCTIPMIPGDGVSFDDGDITNGTAAYTGAAADGGPTGTDRMREGYLEVIMMGVSIVTQPIAGIVATPVAVAATHDVNGAPVDCGKVVQKFSDPIKFFAEFAVPFSNEPGTLQEFTEVAPTAIAKTNPAFSYSSFNPLKGFYTLVNADKGQVAGGSAVTLANFRTTPNVTMQAPLDVVQQAPVPLSDEEAYALSFHEPTFNSANTPGIVLTAGNIPVTAPNIDPAYFGSDQVSWLLLRSGVVNQYTKRTDSLGWMTATDWVLTHPTKAFYVDNNPDSVFAAINKWRGPRADQEAPSITSPFPNYFDDGTKLYGKSCAPVSFNLWDREEKKSAVTRFSPAPQDPNLCYEVNVLTFAQSNILGSGSGITNNIGSLPGATGWLNLYLGSAANVYEGAAYGLPVVGFSVTTRDTGDGSLNEAFLIDHSYTRAGVLNPSPSPAR